MLGKRLLLWLTALLFSLVAVTAATAVRGGEEFNPRAYTKQTAACPALHRNGGKGDPTVVSINMSELVRSSIGQYTKATV